MNVCHAEGRLVSGSQLRRFYAPCDAYMVEELRCHTAKEAMTSCSKFCHKKMVLWPQRDWLAVDMASLGIPQLLGCPHRLPRFATRIVIADEFKFGNIEQTLVNLNINGLPQSRVEGSSLRSSVYDHVPKDARSSVLLLPALIGPKSGKTISDQPCRPREILA